MIEAKYQRVIPRDLFNEAKLLKCMGRLILNIHSGVIPFPMEFEHDGEPFKIHQLISGDIYIANITIKLNDEHYTPYTTLNSKDNYPLTVEDYVWLGRVFEEDGSFNLDFIEYFKN